MARLRRKPCTVRGNSATTMSEPKSDSDSTVSAASNPLALSGHLYRVKDAATTGAVDIFTKLATMYTFNTGYGHDGGLVNLTGVVRPAVRCGVKTLNGKNLPHKDEKDTAGYSLHFTYNRLVRHPSRAQNPLLTASQMYAPCVRLECHFKDRDHPDLPP